MTTPRQQERDEQQAISQADGSDVVSLAVRQLESHPHFHSHHQTVRMAWDDGKLVLSGRLPTFHLKQLAAEALHDLGVTIVNHIEVVSSSGLSSLPETASPEQSVPRQPR